MYKRSPHKGSIKVVFCLHSCNCLYCFCFAGMQKKLSLLCVNCVFSFFLRPHLSSEGLQTGVFLRVFRCPCVIVGERMWVSEPDVVVEAEVRSKRVRSAFVIEAVLPQRCWAFIVKWASLSWPAYCFDHIRSHASPARESSSHLYLNCSCCCVCNQHSFMLLDRIFRHN